MYPYNYSIVQSSQFTLLIYFLKSGLYLWKNNFFIDQTGGCFQEDTHLDSPHCIGICSNYYQKYKNSVLILILNRFVHVVNEWPLRLSDNKVTIDLAQSAAWWCQLIFGTFNQELFHEDDAKAIQWFQGGSH